VNAARGGRSGATPAGGPPASPPFARDPWAWATLLAVLVLAARMAGGPSGEPVAEDFDFLRRALLQGMGSLLDGGGSQSFWRPIPHQLYYALLGRAILAAPGAVAALHLALLALGAWRLSRTLRPHWSGPLACMAATFPLLGESVRTIASWPTQFVDLGLFVASAAAVHEFARRRLATGLTALAAALLCKEVAVATAVLLPFVPGSARNARERARLALGVLAVVAVWGAATLAVRHAAGLTIPTRVLTEAQGFSAPHVSPFTRAAWATWGSLRAAWSLPFEPSRNDAVVAVALAALVIAAALRLVRDRDARARLRRSGPWVLWGSAWFTFATASLTPIFPSWQPNRHQHGSVGLGIASTAVLGAAHPALAATQVAVRLVQLARAPGPTGRVEEAVPESGAWMDYARLTRLQRFMRATRGALTEAFPTLPRGAVIAQQNLPLGVEYAFGGDHALQVWYRDSTLHWIRFESFVSDPAAPVTAIVQAEPGHEPPVAIVHPEAMRALFRGQSLVREGRYAELLTELDHADSLQRDTCAVSYRLVSGALRAHALTATGHPAPAESVATRLVALEPGAALPRQVLVESLIAGGRLDAAQAQLFVLRDRWPADSVVARLTRELEARRASSRGAARER